MSDFSSAMQKIADNCSVDRPSVGKNVIVTEGRKHMGKSGVVITHMRDKYHPNYHKTEASLMLQEIIGREGFVVQVKTETGEKFFVKASYVKVVQQDKE